MIRMDDSNQLSDQQTDEEPQTGPALFDAVLEPHRSLSPYGFLILMVLIGLVGFGAGTAFMLIGAWPVVGFLGLDVLLIYLAFKVNYRSGRMHESVRLTEDTLTVIRVNARGRIQRWQFQPYWLRVNIDNPPRHDSQLTLSSHGRSLIVGSFLTPSERLAFAQALKEALHRLHEPRVAT